MSRLFNHGNACCNHKQNAYHDVCEFGSCRGSFSGYENEDRLESARNNAEAEPQERKRKLNPLFSIYPFVSAGSVLGIAKFIRKKIRKMAGNCACC